MKTAMRIVSKGYFHSIEEFHMQKDATLGVGSFGTVKLAIHIRTSKPYAIKVVDIGEGLSENQIKILQREILIHSTLDHPHVIKLWDTIREGTKIYIVLDYAAGGSLFHYQNQHQRFSEIDAYKYFFQCLDAVRYLHSQNIMHRDIKPQNLLLDSQNNIKVCDFGWATQNIHQKRSTFCGTYQYMAPQMAYENQYDCKIDIWALGVLLYELIHGHAPFRAKSLEEIREKISKGAYQISNTCSKELKHLIMSVLQFQPEDRPGFEQIASHEWVLKIPQIVLGELVIRHGQNQNLKRMGRKAPVDVNNYISTHAPTHAYSPSSNITGNPTIVTKHKKYESTDFESSKGNFFYAHNDGKLNFNSSLKKEEGIKRALKKKCKTQGEQHIIEKMNFNTADNKSFAQICGKLQPNLSLKRQVSSGNTNAYLNNCNTSSCSKQNNCYSSNKMQTVSAESLRNYDDFNFALTGISGPPSKMKKLEHKINQLTNKYVPDKRRLKTKNMRQIV